MLATEQLLQAKMANTIALLAGALIADNVAKRAVVGQLMGLRLNLDSSHARAYTSSRIEQRWSSNKPMIISGGPHRWLLSHSAWPR